jgi:aminoglycoside 6'-N-acetyltransferase
VRAPKALEGERIRLRPFDEGDVDALWDIINEPSVRPWWGNETRDDVAGYVTDPEIEVWAIEKDGRVIGVIQAWEETEAGYRHAGMDIGVSTEFQDQGHGPEALVLVATYLFEDKGHHRLVIDPAANNHRAIAAYGKVGFKPVGVMRQYERNVDAPGWHDSLLMDMLKDELRGGYAG